WELMVMLTLRWSSASRVFACGRFTGRSLTDIIGAVTSRMMTSTSATSMIGVTFTLGISSGLWTRTRLAPPAAHHRKRGRAELARLVENAHEVAVRHGVLAAQHHEPVRAQLEQRPQRERERIPRHAPPVHDHPAVRGHLQLDAVGLHLLHRLAAALVRGL